MLMLIPILDSKKSLHLMVYRTSGAWQMTTRSTNTSPKLGLRELYCVIELPSPTSFRGILGAKISTKSLPISRHTFF
jgi:hypothetical protein